MSVALVIAIVLSFPFAVSGHWGLLGVGFNNDLGLHLAWAEWLRSGTGPEPDPGYPLGPHGLAVATAAFPGISLGQAFIGEIFAIGMLTGLTALGALRGIATWRRVIGATLVTVCYMAASYFAQAAFKETAEALFVLAVAIYLMDPQAPPRGLWPRVGWALPSSRSPAASSSVTRSPGSPGRSRSSSSGRRRSRPPGGRCARRGCCGSC